MQQAQRRILEEQYAANPPAKASRGSAAGVPPAAAPRQAIKCAAPPAPEKIPEAVTALEVEMKAVAPEPEAVAVAALERPPAAAEAEAADAGAGESPAAAAQAEADVPDGGGGAQVRTGEHSHPAENVWKCQGKSVKNSWKSFRFDGRVWVFAEEQLCCGGTNMLAGGGGGMLGVRQKEQHVLFNKEVERERERDGGIAPPPPP